MSSQKKKEKTQYYTIVFEKYLEVMKEIDQTYNIVCERLKQDISLYSVEEWYESEIPDVVEIYSLLDSFKIFLDEKINNPSKQEIDFCQKNEIKDVLFTKDQLTIMQQYFLDLENKKEYLYNTYNFSCYVN